MSSTARDFKHLVVGRIYDIYMNSGAVVNGLSPIVLRSCLITSVYRSLLSQSHIESATAIVVSNLEVNDYPTMQKFLSYEMFCTTHGLRVAKSDVTLSIIRITNHFGTGIYFVRKSKKCRRSRMMMKIQDLMVSIDGYFQKNMLKRIDGRGMYSGYLNEVLQDAVNLIRGIDLDINEIVLSDEDHSTTVKTDAWGVPSDHHHPSDCINVTFRISTDGSTMTSETDWSMI